MTWIYNQSSGEFFHDTTYEGLGYSGLGDGRNNSDMESVPNVGPIPKGGYSIGPAYNHEKLGPLVMNLDPVGHDAHGRSAFRIHGDSVTHDASKGCIILGRAIRQ